MCLQRKLSRGVDGVVLLNKPEGISSNQALQRVKKIFNANKAGHTGTLDPLATGVLPLCLGEATKFSQFLLDSKKAYRSTYTLGTTTTTGDCQGETTLVADASAITLKKVESALDAFRGEIEQVPPMHSAIKHNGQPLYKLARQGVEIPRRPRLVNLYKYQILDFRSGDKAQLDVDIHCSKGTYVRSLAEDLGKALGCGAHVSALHRYVVGSFDEQQSMTLKELEAFKEKSLFESLDMSLMPVDALVADRVAVELNETVAVRFQCGQIVMSNKIFHGGQEGDIVRVFAERAGFLGIGTVMGDGRIAPKRLIAGN